MKRKSNRGSEWHKWDLHVHTPLSIEQNYGGDSNSVWDQFISELETLPEEIKAIGINDYLFIDGYKKVLKYKEQGRLENIQLILPVIEFRLKNFVGHTKMKKINYHVIFADESTLSPDLIEQQFLSCLYGRAKLDSNYEGKGWGGVVNKNSLSDLGKMIRETTREDKRDGLPGDIKLGFQNISFSLEDIFDALGREENKNSYLENNFLTAIGKSEWEDFKWTEAGIADKKTIINQCDFVFSASPTPEDVLKAKDRLIEQKVNSRLLHCSDAHDYLDSQQKTNKLGHCFTWVKSDLTFEGLKQVVYEPDERVCIQRLRPEDSKIPSTIIDSVSYKNKDKEVKVFFNQNLNSLIGVKGSGKSNLLKNITFVSNKNEYEKRKLKDDDLLKLDDFKVSWKDGATSNESSESNSKKVLFIPQKYLGSKVYEEEGGSSETMNEFIDELFFENRKFRESRDNFDEIKNKATKSIEGFIQELLTTSSNIESNENNLSKRPKEGELKLEIKAKNKKLEKLKKDVNLKDTELKTYRECSDQKVDIESKIAQRKGDIDLYKQLKKAGMVDLESMLSEFEFSDDEQGEITSHIKNYNKAGKDFMEERIKAIAESIEIDDKAIKDLEERIKPTQEKIEKNKEVEKIAEGIKKDTAELKVVQSITSQNKKEEEKKKELSKKIKEGYKQTVRSLKECLKNISIDLPDEVSIIFSLKFNMESFKNFLSKVNSNTFPNSVKSWKENLNIIGEKLVFVMVDELFDKLLSGETVLNKNNDLRTCLHDLFDFRYNLDYLNGIKNQEEVTLKEMSAGQKMLTLLSLIFSLDENRYPILIDQPEDDLDSTTISTIVSNFLKKQKKERQIIIASHNANLVICSDSEQVLVANKEATNRFIYQTGSIEKEGINKQIVEVLEGGEEAFRKRRSRYYF